MTSFVQASDGLWIPEHLTEPGAGVVFCDESGNSGPNYLDTNQPFYVLAGWLVPEDHVVEVAVAVESFRQRHFPQRPELKAEAILRNDRTKRLGADLFLKLGKLHCVPIYLVAEKRYCVAGKVVETFLDPAYNDIVKDPITYDVETKQEIANTLYEQLDAAVLDGFAHAYQAPTPDHLEAVLHNVAQTIDRDISEALGRALLGSLAHIQEIARAEASHWLPRNVDATLNMPSLVSFLMLIENLGRLGLVRPIRVVHDRHHAYEEAYAKIFELHKGVPRLFARLPHTDVAYSGLEHVADFETRDSKDSPIIQAADLLAGAIAHCCKLAMNDSDASEADIALADLVMLGLLVPEPRLTWLVCSEHCIRQLGSKVLKPALARIIPDVARRDEQVNDALAPMFPSRLSPRPTTAERRLLLDFPMYGIVGVNSGGLMGVVNDEFEEGPMRSLVFLFSTRERAESFLAYWEEDELTEPQEIVEFGPKDARRLTDLMLSAAEWSTCAAFDPDNNETLKLLPLKETAEEIRARFDRVMRLFASGLDRVLTDRVAIGGVEILAMQTSDGKFGAMVHPRGKIYFGSSKQEAIDGLKEGEGLTLSSNPTPALEE